MPLYLTGGGDQEDFRGLDRLFLENLPKGAAILVIPLAVEGDYEEALERAEDCFAGKKVDAIDMCEDVDKLAWEDLEKYDAVFIEGGNTFVLIQAVRQSAFFKNLQRYLEAGHSIYADSAGAIVLGTNVRTAFFGEEGDEDEKRLQDYRGLGVIGPWTVHCHYEPGDQDEIQDLLYDSGHPILALAEPTGVCIDGNTVKVFGRAPLEVFTFTGHKTFQPGATLDLDDVQQDTA